MSLAASRAVLRHSTFAVRRAGLRNASTTSEAAGAAKEKAAEASSKASEGLSKVTSSAGSAISKVGAATAGALGKVGGRTGRLIGTVQAYIPRVVYYSRVGLELGKLVVQQRGLAPPNSATFQGYYQSLVKSVRNPSALVDRTASATQPTTFLSRARNLSRAELLSVGVVAAEVIGFFTVGEIIGRFKVVGYRAASEHH